MKAKIKIFLIIVAIVAISIGSASAQTNKQMLGAKLNLNTITGNGSIGLYLAGEGGIGFLPIADNQTKQVFLLGGYLGPSISLGESDLRLNLAGGFEQNITFERGQYGVLAGLSGSSWSLEGVKLIPTNKDYAERYKNWMISGTYYFSTVGIGVFYQKEYECNYIGAKLSIRFGLGGSGVSSRKTGRTYRYYIDPCCY